MAKENLTANCGKDCNFVIRRGGIERENRMATREGVNRKVNIMKVGLHWIFPLPPVRIYLFCL